MCVASEAFTDGTTPVLPYALVAVEGPAGCGKRALARWLAARPGAAGLRLAPRTSAALEELAGRLAGPDGQRGRVPANLLHTASLVECAVQFEYARETFAGADLVVADRWLQTWEVYCGDIGEYAEWYLQIAAQVPPPDVLLYLRVSPRVAAARLARVLCRDEAALLRHTTALCARYDEVMSGVDCVVVDADPPAPAVLAHVAGVLREAGLAAPVTAE
ncbi:hypothetical protein MXD63_22100 [Frankia sp. Cpl3]|uniref:hypothetical protein n=1 Tax=Parafrankia colletiae TaxID=573497 RepID=UPI000AE2657E|nr:hypothetical protein [Parafrankia colletiae]MCK9902752.1 hypothetical protein [Frankia sp. Cpl3]